MTRMTTEQRNARKLANKQFEAEEENVRKSLERNLTIDECATILKDVRMWLQTETAQYIRRNAHIKWNTIYWACNASKDFAVQVDIAIRIVCE